MFANPAIHGAGERLPFDAGDRVRKQWTQELNDVADDLLGFFVIVVVEVARHVSGDMNIERSCRQRRRFRARRANFNDVAPAVSVEQELEIANSLRHGPIIPAAVAAGETSKSILRAWANVAAMHTDFSSTNR